MRPPSRRRPRGLVAWLLFASAALPAAARADAPPDGWRVIKDRKGNCQMIVPNEWKGTASMASPENRQAMAAIHLLPGKDWSEAKAMAEHVMTPQEIVEDGPERFWFVFSLRAERNPADAEEVPATGKTTPATPVAKPGAAAGRAPAPAGAPPPKPTDVGWYVTVPGPLGPCVAQITFKDESLADIARQIALSVAAVVPTH